MREILSTYHTANIWKKFKVKVGQLLFVGQASKEKNPSKFI